MSHRRSILSFSYFVSGVYVRLFFFFFHSYWLFGAVSAMRYGFCGLHYKSTENKRIFIYFSRFFFLLHFTQKSEDIDNHNVDNEMERSWITKKYG